MTEGGYYDNRGRWVEPKRRGDWWKSFLPRVVVNALAMTITDILLPGLHFSGFVPLFLAALLFTFINWSLKPLIHVLSLPLTILSFGIFALIINGAFLALVAGLVPGFSLASFWTAIGGSILITIFNTIITMLLPN